jgi:hypothetical protein
MHVRQAWLIASAAIVAIINQKAQPGGAMQRQLLIVVLTAVSIMTGSDGIRAQDTGPRAFVLDQEARTLTALDVSSGAMLHTAALQGSPNTVLRTADRKRLLVLDRGTGRDAGDDGFQEKTKSALTIVDGETFTVTSRVALGWGLAPIPMLSSSEGRLAVICEGYTGRRPGV